MKQLEDMTEPELRDVMNRVGKAIQSELPPETGFIVLAVPAGGRIVQYVGNVPRASAKSMMMETIDRWETSDFVPR